MMGFFCSIQDMSTEMRLTEGVRQVCIPSGSVRISTSTTRAAASTTHMERRMPCTLMRLALIVINIWKEKGILYLEFFRYLSVQVGYYGLPSVMNFDMKAALRRIEEWLVPRKGPAPNSWLQDHKKMSLRWLGAA